MPTTHVIKQGEHLSGIAADSGFTSIDPIWLHGDNAELKQQRKHPHVLLPGDKLVIPDLEQRTEDGPTNQAHQFVLKRDELMLRLVLLDTTGEPLARTTCTLRLDSNVEEVTTDGNGQIEVPIDRTTKRGTLIVGDLEMPLKIGHLDPVDELSGQRARFNNLGYYAGESDDEEDDLFKSAVEEFQCDHDLAVDGICGPNTQAKLEEVYGY